MAPCSAAQFSGERVNSFRKDRALVLVADQGSLEQFCVGLSHVCH
jgi:hypothetical protein